MSRRSCCCLQFFEDACFEKDLKKYRGILQGESLFNHGNSTSMNSNVSDTGSLPPGASTIGRVNSVSSSNKSINSNSGQAPAGSSLFHGQGGSISGSNRSINSNSNFVHPGMSLMNCFNSMSGSNKSINSNNDYNYAPPGSSTLPNPRHHNQQQQQDFNRSLSASEGGGASLQPGTSMLGLDKGRSLSNTSDTSVGNYPAGTSIMNLNGSGVPGQSLMNLNRSVSAQSSYSADIIPGIEDLTLDSSTQTLPKLRPQLMPGMSVVESDECHSAPVTTGPLSSFNFNTHHRRSSSTRVAGTSVLNVNDSQSNASLAGGEDDVRQSFRLQPGISMMDNFESTSQLSTSPETYTTALMDFKTDARSGQDRGQQQDQMQRLKSGNVEDWICP